MEYRKLGTSDLHVSAIGLGTNNFGNPSRIPDPPVSARVIHQCLDVGINFIDTSNNYGRGQSEVHIGEALKGRRDEAIIATKFNLNRLEGESIPDRINRCVDESLGKLQTDHIDLYQIHWPVRSLPHEEVLGPLNDLVQAGKVRYIGECNYSSGRHAQSDAVSKRDGWPAMVSSQNYYNLFRRQIELELLPFCTENDIGVLPYYPLAGGWLTGKYKASDTAPDGSRRMVGQLQGDDRARDTLAKLDAFAAERGHTMLELAFSWLLAHPAVSSVIAGAMTPEQVQANAAAGGWAMTEEERDAIDDIASWDGDGEDVEGFGAGGSKIIR